MQERNGFDGDLRGPRIELGRSHFKIRLALDAAYGSNSCTLMVASLLAGVTLSANDEDELRNPTESVGDSQSDTRL